MKHDALVTELRRVARAIDAHAIASAFVASLPATRTSDLGPWRTALGALALGLAVPSHRRTQTYASGACKECGLEEASTLDAFAPARDRIPGALDSALVVLRAAATATAPRPTKANITCLSKLLAIVGSLPPRAGESKLNAAIATSKLVGGDRYARRHVIETLGLLGILETPEYPGVATRWTSFAVRDGRGGRRTECEAPIALWTAAHGVNAAAVSRWFGHLGLTVPGASAPRADAVARASKAAAKCDARAARATELAVGDAIAFATSSGFAGAIVIAHQSDRSGTVPIIDLLEWRGASLPSLDELGASRASGRRLGDRQIVAPMSVYDLWHRDDPRGRWQFIGSGLPAPGRSHLEAVPGTTVQRVDGVLAQLDPEVPRLRTRARSARRW